MHRDRSISRLTRTPTAATRRPPLDLNGSAHSMTPLPRSASLSPSFQDWKQEKLAKALLELEAGSRSHASSIADPTEPSLAAGTPPTFEREPILGVPIQASAASNQLAIRIASVVVALLLLLVVLVYFNLSAIHRR
ncbi:uncharacterized protein LOC119374126 [Rhipicephalus sanguineus]|uniref:uncharacterized protein LOC119374126 n=1 Tax=Rhipicephalus sanguineus TaxID=34632 RepID=UPI001893B438|nr:uncharacterized protein LOC119374126 [Rhipicephalus sanguineus]